MKFLPYFIIVDFVILGIMAKLIFKNSKSLTRGITNNLFSDFDFHPEHKDSGRIREDSHKMFILYYFVFILAAVNFGVYFLYFK